MTSAGPCQMRFGTVHAMGFSEGLPWSAAGNEAVKQLGLCLFEHLQAESVGHAGDVVADGSLQTILADESLEVTRN